MAAKNKYVKLGALIKGKDGGYYIKLENDLKLNVNGSLLNKKYINVESPSLKYDRMLNKGVISETEHEEKVSSIPDFVKYELVAVLDA